MADTHEGTVPSFTITSPAISDQFNLTGELPKIDSQDCLHFETDTLFYGEAPALGTKWGGREGLDRADSF